MSTIDSLGLISAITFGRDILWRIQTPSGIDQELWHLKSIQFIRKGLAVTAFIALGLAFSVPSVVNLWYGLGSILVPGLVLPFLLSFTENRPTSGIVLMMVCPVIFGLIWLLWGNLSNGYPFDLEPFYIGILTSGLIYALKVNFGKRN